MEEKPPEQTPEPRKKIPPIKTTKRPKKDKAGKRRGWHKSHQKKNREKVREKIADLIGSTEIPVTASKTGEGRKVVPNINLKDLASADMSVEQKDALKKVSDLLRVQLDRKSEALKIWEPLEIQEQFHKSRCRVRLIRGSNRSGKTLVAAVEIARAVTGTDPHNKYPKRGDVYIVTEEWGEVGRVIYPKLCRPGAFKVIRDKTTGHLRAYRPWDVEDRKRLDQARDAAPLIPKRYIESIAWHDKKLGQPKIIRLKNGWTIHFFSGESKPPSGSAIDIAWLDEEIAEAEWFVELNSRIAEREGIIVWTATPEIGTDQFHDYCQKAMEQIYLEPQDRDAEEYKLALADNPHITDRAKAGMASMLSDQDYQIRVLGEFASVGRIIFPEYKRMVHGIDYFEIPPRWTRYVSIDPGHQICAVLFGAVPDPVDMMDREDPFDLVLYDELYLPKCSARIFAEAMERRCRGQDFEDFVIDMHGSRVTEAGTGLSIYDQYRDALAQKEVRCRKRGSAFAMGDDDVKSSIERCRYYLGLRSAYANAPGQQTPRVRVMCKRDERGQYLPLLPNFDWEVTRWKYKVISGHATEDAETRGRCHLMATFRYLCGLNPKYVLPTYRRSNPVLDMLDREQRAYDRQMSGQSTGRVVFGPAGAC